MRDFILISMQFFTFKSFFSRHEMIISFDRLTTRAYYSTSISPLNPNWISEFCNSYRSYALVIWGSQGSLGPSVGLGRFTKKLNIIIILPPYYFSVIVGVILGDGWLTFGAAHVKNARLGFAQSLDHFEYLWHVFMILSPYCNSYPIFRHRTRFGKSTFGLQFFTRSLSCFTELHSLFYVNGVKIIPSDIYNLLTPIALAHWIMGDGFKDGNGLVLCTNFYTIKDTVRLMNVLMIRYKIDCTLRFMRNREPMIYIRTSSMPLLRSIVLSHMCPSMLYKLSL